MADTVTKISMDIYRKFEKSRVLNIIEDLQVPDILGTCLLYNLQWKYIKKYISIQASILLFVSFVLKWFLRCHASVLLMGDCNDYFACLPKYGVKIYFQYHRIWILISFLGFTLCEINF
jgi:hypothetical protein